MAAAGMHHLRGIYAPPSAVWPHHLGGISKDHTEMETLTPYAAHELIQAIYIGAPDKSSGKRRQAIQICYDLVGFIPLDELMKQETA